MASISFHPRACGGAGAGAGDDAGAGAVDSSIWGAVGLSAKVV